MNRPYQPENRTISIQLPHSPTNFSSPPGDKKLSPVTSPVMSLRSITG